MDLSEQFSISNPSSNSQQNHAAVLRKIIKEKCILTADDNWLVSTAGNDYGWLIDMRHAFLDAEALDACAEIFWNRFEASLPFQIGGLEIAAIPLVVALVMKARTRGFSVNGFIIRKERKPSGVGKIFEGLINEDPIFIVDDIINSASTLEKVRVNLATLGRRIDRAFAVIHYKSPQGLAWLTRHELTAEFIFTLQDFDLRSGRKAAKSLQEFETTWSYSPGKSNHFYVVPKSSPLLVDGKVIFGSDRGMVWALDAWDGRGIWRFGISDPNRKGVWSRPALHDGTVLFGGYDGNLYCVSAEDGRELWRNTDADWIGSSPCVDSLKGLLWIGLEYARPGAHGAVASFAASSGEKIWEVPLSMYVHGTPVLSPDRTLLAVGSNDGMLHVLDSATGETRGSFQTGGPIKEAPTFDEERGAIYCTSFDGKVRGIDIDTLDLIWEINTGNSIYSQPLLAGGTLFVSGMDKNLHVVNLDTGRHVEHFLGSKSVSSPCLCGETIFVGSNNGVVFEFDGEGRGLVGRHQLPDPVTSRIAYSHETSSFYAVTHMNELFAFRRS